MVLSPKGDFLHLPRAHQEWGGSGEAPTSQNKWESVAVLFPEYVLLEF